ncbi:MAG TPA: VOC family protein [Caulobacteraceae bacterium]|jgi:catechol 2,3-dioxygenase-like lactoylglutathione lyase family enzyme|nr:VOC family protein [Caulobacteraceae bacterium]
MIAGFDHIPVVVRDLDAAVARYTAMFGRAPGWTGRLPGARHAWFQLANVAIEVIAADGDGIVGERTRLWLADREEGPTAMGFATPAFDEARRTLERRGVLLDPPEESRSIDDAGRERVWRYVMARPATTRGIELFLVDRGEAAAPWPISPPTGDVSAALAGIDHVVVRTQNAEAAIALYGAKLDLDLRLDRSNPDWGSRLLFFRCGDAVVEIGAGLNAPVTDEPDRMGGFAWRAPEPEAAQARMLAAGLDVSELRKGRKPGTNVFTVRDAIGGANLIISASNDAGD